MTVRTILDRRDTLTLSARAFPEQRGQRRTIQVHSKFFNQANWGQTERLLDLANADRLKSTAPKATPAPVVVSNADIESAKVANSEKARLLGLTVKALRGLCRERKLRGYSSARKSMLVDMLINS